MKTMLQRMLKVMVALVAIAVLIVVIAWSSGYFEKKIEPGELAGTTIGTILPASAEVVRVTEREVPVYVRAPGTVRARQKTAVGSRLLAPVEKVFVVAGQYVSAGDVLVKLDQADLLARQKQTQADLEAGQARLSKAEDDLRRVLELQKNDAATEQELYDAKRAKDVAQADVNSLQQRLAEVTTQLSYATIRAPFDGIVVDKQIDEGDLAKPGETLVTLYDPTRLQLEADVPESIALKLKPGELVGVQINSISANCEGTVSEIVPQASPASRSLLVKVTGPCPPGVVTGMFGRLIIQTGERKQFLIPISAVERVGQLEMVYVVKNTNINDKNRVVEKRFIQTGEPSGDEIEVLSGLSADDSVVVDPMVLSGS